MINTWSDEVRIMFHPLVTYGQLAAEPYKKGFRSLLQRLVLVALAFGAFVSFTVSGRLTIPLLFDGAYFWSFVPILQTLIMAGIVLTFGRGRISTSRALDLFLMGYGPLLLWMLGIGGTCLFLPLKRNYLLSSQAGWIIAVSLLGIWLWSNVISFAFLNNALSFTTLKAGGALMLYTVMFWGIILTYLFAMEILQLHRLTF